MIADILNKKEELCHELKYRLNKIGSFTSLQHPLLYCVPYFPNMNALLNLQLQKKQQKAAEFLSNRKYASYVFLHEKPHRFNAFDEIEQELSDKDYWEILSEVWINSENIWQNKQLWFDSLHRNRSQKHFFMDAEERKIFKNLPDKVTVYRGYKKDKNKEGFSYTLSKEKATWFSKRYDTKGHGEVYTRVVDKKDIFAYLNGRNEQEVIILK